MFPLVGLFASPLQVGLSPRETQTMESRDLAGTVDQEAATVESTDEANTVPQEEPTVARPHLLTLHYRPAPETPVKVTDKLPRERVRKSAGESVVMGRGVNADVLLNDEHMPRRFVELCCRAEGDSGQARWFIKNLSDKKAVRWTLNGTRVSVKGSEEKEIPDGCELKLETLKFLVRVEDGDMGDNTEFEVEFLPMDSASSGSSSSMSMRRQNSSSTDSSNSLTSAADLPRPRADSRHDGGGHTHSPPPPPAAHCGLPLPGPPAPHPGPVLQGSSPFPGAASYTAPNTSASSACCPQQYYPQGYCPHHQYPQYPQAYYGMTGAVAQHPFAAYGPLHTAGVHAAPAGPNAGPGFQPYHSPAQHAAPPSTHTSHQQTPGLPSAMPDTQWAPPAAYPQNGLPQAWPEVQGFSQQDPRVNGASSVVAQQSFRFPTLSSQEAHHQWRHEQHQPGSHDVGASHPGLLQQHPQQLPQHPQQHPQQLQQHPHQHPQQLQQHPQQLQQHPQQLQQQHPQQMQQHPQQMQQHPQQLQQHPQQMQQHTHQHPQQQQQPQQQPQQFGGRLYGPLSMPAPTPSSGEQMGPSVCVEYGEGQSWSRPAAVVAQPESAAVHNAEPVWSPHAPRPPVVTNPTSQDWNTQLYHQPAGDLPAAPPATQLGCLKLGIPVQVTAPMPTEAVTASPANSLSHSGPGGWTVLVSSDASFQQTPSVVQGPEGARGGRGEGPTAESSHSAGAPNEAGPAHLADNRGEQQALAHLSEVRVAGRFPSASQQIASAPPQIVGAGSLPQGPAAGPVFSSLTDAASNGNRLNLRRHERVSADPSPSADFTSYGSSSVQDLQGAHTLQGLQSQGLQSLAAQGPQSQAPQHQPLDSLSRPQHQAQAPQREPQEDDERRPQEHDDRQ